MYCRTTSGYQSYSSALFVGWVRFFSVFPRAFYKTGLGVCALQPSVRHAIDRPTIAVDGDSLKCFERCRHQCMVSDSCGNGDPLVTHRWPGRVPWHYLYLRGLFTTSFNQRRARFTQSNDVMVSLACYPVQLRWNILGGIWADQSWGRFWGWDQGERSASYRPVERHQFFTPAGWVHSRTWTCSDECFGNIVVVCPGSELHAWCRSGPANPCQ